MLAFHEPANYITKYKTITSSFYLLPSHKYHKYHGKETKYFELKKELGGYDILYCNITGEGTLSVLTRLQY